MTTIRLVPKVAPKPLSIGDMQDVAKGAYAKAKAAQRALAAHLVLIEMMHRPGSVSYVRLRGERTEAQSQLKRAQNVLDAINEAIEAMESTVPTPPATDNPPTEKDTP